MCYAFLHKPDVLISSVSDSLLVLEDNLRMILYNIDLLYILCFFILRMSSLLNVSPTNTSKCQLRTFILNISSIQHIMFTLDIYKEFSKIPNNFLWSCSYTYAYLQYLQVEDHIYSISPSIKPFPSSLPHMFSALWLYHDSIFFNFSAILHQSVLFYYFDKHVLYFCYVFIIVYLTLSILTS